MGAVTAGTLGRPWVARFAPALALVAGGTAFALVAVAVAAAHPAASPLSPDRAGDDTRWSWLYLGALSAAFLFYLLGLLALARRTSRLLPVLVVSTLIQTAPLAAPVLLSTDAYTYWAYGRLEVVHGENPYTTTPAEFPNDPAYPRMGADWRDTASVYGPGFTLVSEGVAAGSGRSPAAAAWAFRVIATVSMLTLVGLAALLGRRAAFAAAFVGWNPLLAIHFAGGGHNDALMMALVLGALALASRGRLQLAGVSWAAAIALKWVPAVFLILRAAEARATGRPTRHLGFALAAGGFVGLAFWRYGTGWLSAAVPVAKNLEHQAVYSIPHQLSSLLAVSEYAVSIAFGVLFAISFLWLLREALRGRARLGLAAGLMLVATPWLVPWYAVWAVPLAAVEEDRAARALALAMSAYLLRDAVPL
jgi:alpha-1,6-mannosyltransferase